MRRITEWQGWKNVNRSLASSSVSMMSKVEERKYCRKSPGASNYLDELTGVGTQ